MHGDRRFRAISIAQLGNFYAIFLSFGVLAMGCQGASPGAALSLDSREQLVKDRIAFNHKAAKVMITITDEKTADAAVPALKSLCEENQRIHAREKELPKTVSPEEKEVINKKYLSASQASVKVFGEAAGPFSNGRRLQFIHKYLEKQHGIDIQRFKLVEKK